MKRIEKLREANRNETQTLRLIQNELSTIVEALEKEPYKTQTLAGEECVLSTKQLIWELIKYECEFQLTIIEDEKIEQEEDKVIIESIAS